MIKINYYKLFLHFSLFYLKVTAKVCSLMMMTCKRSYLLIIINKGDNLINLPKTKESESDESVQWTIK